MTWRLRPLAVATVAGLVFAHGAPRAQAPAVTLSGFARLPADTFAAGPPSGAFLDGGRRADARFAAQPVQGVSALAPAGDGWWWALVDNGFGTRLNSPDALLRIYRMRPRWREPGRGEGTVEIASAFVQLADPDRRLPFRIAREDDPARLLTGSDLDPESLAVADDGTFWIGDEFGPFLVHVDGAGRVLEAPIEAAGVRSPDHPLLPPADRGRASEATVGRSRGFEGLSLLPGTTRLLALLEAGSAADAPGGTRLLEFDIATRRWTGRSWRYRFEPLGVAASEVACFAPDGCLVVERDDGHGPQARFKQVFAVTLGPPGGEMAKRLVADLLRIADPEGLAASGSVFTFPFITTEAVWPLDRQTLVLANDNNFPATGGREPGVRDATEFIRLRLGAPLW